MSLYIIRILILSTVFVQAQPLFSMNLRQGLDSDYSGSDHSGDEGGLMFQLELNDTKESKDFYYVIGGEFKKKTKIFKDCLWNSKGYTQCHEAILKRDSVGLLKIIKPKSDNFINEVLLNKKSQEGLTPLAFAVFRKEVQCVNVLLNNKALVNEVNDDGDTPLMILLKSTTWSDENDDILERLLEAGADYEKIKNNNGKTTFEIAEEKNRTDYLSTALKKSIK